MGACFLVLLVVADVEGVLGDEADQLLRELVEFRRERRDERVEVVALVAAEAARGDHFLDVRVGCVRYIAVCLRQQKIFQAPVPGPGGLSQERL